MASETSAAAFDTLAEPTVPACVFARQAAARCLPVVMAVSACGLLGWGLAGRGWLRAVVFLTALIALAAIWRLHGGTRAA